MHEFVKTSNCTLKICAFLYENYTIKKKIVKNMQIWENRCFNWLSQTLLYFLCREVEKLRIYFAGLLAARLLAVNCSHQLGVFMRDVESRRKAIPLCHLSKEFQVNKWSMANGSAGRCQTPCSTVGWVGGSDNVTAWQKIVTECQVSNLQISAVVE